MFHSAVAGQGRADGAQAFPRLLGDIGGTHARFAWQDGPGRALSDIAIERCAEHPTLGGAIRHYLQAAGKPAPHSAALGIANPVIGDEVRMTNHHWCFSIGALQRELQLQRLLVLNDFEALALALPGLAADELQPVGGGAADPAASCAVIGPGTGLGVAGLLPGRARAVTGEGGHATLAPTDDRESAVIGWLRRRHGHVSAERVLSGSGLVNLYDAISALDETPAEALRPAEVVDRALAGTDPACGTAVTLFCGFLGNVAGNVALTLGARGGVYIGGGIVPRLGAAFAASPFRARFEGKGRFRDYLAAIPTWVIVTAQPPALLGAARALDSLG
jgi:glucokinase